MSLLLREICESIISLQSRLTDLLILAANLADAQLPIIDSNSTDILDFEFQLDSQEKSIVMLVHVSRVDFFQCELEIWVGQALAEQLQIEMGSTF